MSAKIIVQFLVTFSAGLSIGFSIGSLYWGAKKSLDLTGSREE